MEFEILEKKDIFEPLRICECVVPGELCGAVGACPCDCVILMCPPVG